MSAILVKMPPRYARPPRPNDSPMAKPMKHGPAKSAGHEEQDEQHITSSTLNEHHANANTRAQRDGIDGMGQSP